MQEKNQLINETNDAGDLDSKARPRYIPPVLQRLSASKTYSGISSSDTENSTFYSTSPPAPSAGS